jgi:hypothetical protein
MRKGWISSALSAAAILVAVGVASDLVRGTLQKRELTRAEQRSRIPLDILDPATARVKLTGADLAAFLKRRPLKVGDPAPELEVTDFRRRQVRIPSGDGRPTIVVVSCGCQICSGYVRDAERVSLRAASKPHLLAIVANRSEYAWGHYAGTFAFHEAVHLVQDKEGTLLQQMRPPGSDPTQLPLIWVANGAGRVGLVEQPKEGANCVQPLLRAVNAERLARRQ